MRKVVKDGKTQLNAKVPKEIYDGVDEWSRERNIHMQDAVSTLLEHALKNPPPAKSTA